MSTYDSALSDLSAMVHLTDQARQDHQKVYDQLCASYRAIDDFRAKLLGFLPIASLAGLLVLGKDPLIGQERSRHLIGFAGFFAAAFTLALFLFEIRGILRCSFLIERGAAIERTLGVPGQFCVCTQRHTLIGESTAEQFFNVPVAASAIYSLVFSAWLFLALKFAFDFTIKGCGLTAIGVGGILAVGASYVVKHATES